MLEVQKKYGGILFKDEFKELPKSEKKEVIIREFVRCSKDIEYYMKNYAFVRHPNAGIIKFEPFDFQWDIIKTVSLSLLKGREEAYEELVKYKNAFDYKKWIERIEKNVELLKKVPEEVHEQYTVWIDVPEWKATPDYIILKSRQTGLSTVFGQITNWFTNFHMNTVTLIVSQRDQEAKKFLTDVKIYYRLLPDELKAKQLKDNDHELFLSITGDKKDVSIAQSFAPSPDVGRSYSPNFVILDEFAMYKKAEEVWTAISMAVSTGGIICIISTPKGVGNLYHQFWTESVKNVRSLVHIESNNLDARKDREKYVKPFKPYVVHWSQLPEEEFKRRGFKDPLEWYEFMKSKFISEGGLKKVAQELDLEFLSSGDTVIPADVIKYLRENRCIEDFIEKPLSIRINTHNVEQSPLLKAIYEKAGIDYDKLVNIVQDASHYIDSVKVYRKPKNNERYMIGVDVAEGLGKDYSVFYVMNVPESPEEVPQLYCYFASNRIPPKRFAYLTYIVALIYNDAFLNIERNSVGISVIETLEEIYKRSKILSTYNPNKKGIDKFSKNEKGWKETTVTRKYLIDSFVDFVLNYKDVIEVNRNLVEELTTFIDTGKRYEHMRGYHDDHIFSYALTVVGIRILPKYLEFLEEKNSDELTEVSDIPDDTPVSSSLLKEEDKFLAPSIDEIDSNTFKILKDKGITKDEYIKKLVYEQILKKEGFNEEDINEENLVKRKLLKIEGKESIKEKEKETEEKKNPTGHRFLSHEMPLEDEEDFYVF